MPGLNSHSRLTHESVVQGEDVANGKVTSFRSLVQTTLDPWEWVGQVRASSMASISSEVRTIQKIGGNGRVSSSKWLGVIVVTHTITRSAEHSTIRRRTMWGLQSRLITTPDPTSPGAGPRVWKDRGILCDGSETSQRRRHDKFGVFSRWSLVVRGFYWRVATMIFDSGSRSHDDS